VKRASKTVSERYETGNGYGTSSLVILPGATAGVGGAAGVSCAETVTDTASATSAHVALTLRRLLEIFQATLEVLADHLVK
jgi:hypothetical protein